MFLLVCVYAQGILREHNYLINKSVSIGKGPKTVISLLHCNFTNLVQGRNKFRYLLKILADQNKKLMYCFTCYREFLLVHTTTSQLNFVCWAYKFCGRLGFGLVNRKHLYTKVSCLADTARLVDKSFYVNTALLTRDETGAVHVPMFNRVDFLSVYQIS